MVLQFQPVLQARIARNVSGIDSQLYDEAVTLQRKFLEEIEQQHSAQDAMET